MIRFLMCGFFIVFRLSPLFCAVGCCCLLVCVCDLVLRESSGTGLFYHFRQALSVTDDIVMPFFPLLGYVCP